MNTHPYLRAYMAGIFVPSLFLLLILAVFVVARFVFQVPIPIERAMVFPMALVPNLFGCWNIFYVWLRRRRQVSIGFHGALLPLLMAPVGAVAASWLGFLTIDAHRFTWFDAVTAPYYLIGPWFVAALIVYYLMWKHIIGFLNQVLGIG